MRNLVKNLESFNRKERFFLVGAALGNPTFRLDPTFRDQVGREFGLDVPEEAFVAMDYHLDWIYAGLVVSSAGPTSVVFPNPAGHFER